ncbi:mediator complex, subunit Med7 [Globomyces pollinis-pini]|nr:mediator complex, subunit Med7 [Globomyces pollinis-pini]
MTELSTTFPLPPKYYLNYTDENLALKDSSDLPLEFPNLNPPKPPSSTQPFMVFGQLDQLEVKLPSLEELGIQPLENQSDLDVNQKLQSINHSLLLNLVELLSILTTNTCEASYKTEQIRLLFIHFHHYINEYRPHQARATLMMILKDQIQKKKTATKEIRDKIQSTRDQLERLSETLEKI